MRKCTVSSLISAMETVCPASGIGLRRHIGEEMARIVALDVAAAGRDDGRTLDRDALAIREAPVPVDRVGPRRGGTNSAGKGAQYNTGQAIMRHRRQSCSVGTATARRYGSQVRRATPEAEVAWPAACVGSCGTDIVHSIMLTGGLKVAQHNFLLRRQIVEFDVIAAAEPSVDATGRYPERAYYPDPGRTAFWDIVAGEDLRQPSGRICTGMNPIRYYAIPVCPGCARPSRWPSSGTQPKPIFGS